MLRHLLLVLFPRRCISCGAAQWPFCRRCSPAVASLLPPGCLRCGRPFEVDVPRCGDCPPQPVGWARAAYLYDGPVRRALIQLKFAGARSVAEALAPAMAQALGARATTPEDQAVITWVPLGRERRRRRGFDQAQVLAEQVGTLLDRPVRRLLERSVETEPQARRSGRARRCALKGAFGPVERPPPRLILVDDVMTSGQTAAECARTLLAAGARHVGVLTAARSLRDPVPTRCYNPAGLAAWVCGCPGDPLPVVEASRRRNDPRKATFGR